ncbi:hypothetical protein OAO18_06790 [Francisellaceae bacterium]|nr:hypothetical protein [Francisellaceae bacterium]
MEVVVNNDYKQAIEAHAISYFSDLHAELPPALMASTISYFEFSLSKIGLEDEAEHDIHHSPLLPMSTNWLCDFENIAFGIARIYGHKVIKVRKTIQDKIRYSFCFVGYKHGVHASYISLIKLFELAKEAKKKVKKSLDQNLKKKEIKEETEDFMYDWLEQLTENLSPTAICGDYSDEIDTYIKRTFHTQQEFSESEQCLINFASLLAKAKEGSTNREVMDLYQKKYGHSLESVVEKQKILNDATILVDWEYGY